MLCNRMVLFRTYNNIEPETVAKALNISTEEYLKYEEGCVVPSIEFITELTKIYKVTVNEFYGNTPRLVLHDKEAENVVLEKNDDFEVLKFSELSIDEKEIILAYRTSDNKENLFRLMTEEKNKRD